MRTNIEINDRLMRAAMKLGRFKTKREAVESALRTLIRLRKQQDILELAGKIEWAGDLDNMRQSRFADWQE